MSVFGNSDESKRETDYNSGKSHFHKEELDTTKNRVTNVTDNKANHSQFHSHVNESRSTDPYAVENGIN